MSRDEDGGPARPTCSVVVPVRDDAEHLSRFLDALAAQTQAPDEIIVVDNSSSDHSADLARSRGARVVHEPRVGIPFAAAAGYESATGAIIVRADADTLPRSDWVARLLARLDGEPDAVAVSGSGSFYGMPKLVSEVASALYIGTYVCATGLALGHRPLFGTNLAFRRSWWDQVKHDVHLSASVHDDMDLAFRVRSSEQVVFDPSIRVGMSPRALQGKTWMRLNRGMETVRLNWQDKAPWERWSERWLPA